MSSAQAEPGRPRVNLALQGGGAHGAFTWGVLDRLLEEDGVEIAAISGTSAGALNAAALKAGLVRGGRAGARATLAGLWQAIGAFPPDWAMAWTGGWQAGIPALANALKYSPGWMLFDGASRVLSPYVMGPFLRNPLERLLQSLDFAGICAKEGPELFVCATNVRTGKIRVFEGEEIGPRALLASACLPTLFQAVEIEDPATGRREAYWDGGYSGNPALFPLYDPALPDDIVIVNINPIERAELPIDAAQIANRINEVSFNAALLRDLRAVAFVKRLIAEGKVAKGAMKDVLVHMIADDALMNSLNVATKTIPVPVILARLMEAGRAAADGFLARHRADIGRRPSVDIVAMFS